MNMGKRHRFERFARIAEKLMEWGNFIFVGLVLGQAFMKEINILFVLIGVSAWAASYFGANYLMKRGG